jgi:hypothetical protein
LQAARPSCRPSFPVLRVADARWNLRCCGAYVVCGRHRRELSWENGILRRLSEWRYPRTVYVDNCTGFWTVVQQCYETSRTPLSHFSGTSCGPVRASGPDGCGCPSYRTIRVLKVCAFRIIPSRTIQYISLLRVYNGCTSSGQTGGLLNSGAASGISGDT